MTTRLKISAIASLAATLTAFADIPLNEKFAVSGYISGAASYTETDGVKDSFMDVDAVKLAGTVSTEKVKGMVSLHTFTSHDPVILDAYATYAVSPTTAVRMPIQGKWVERL